MKILFAIGSDTISKNIADKYYEKYGETLEYKNVFYFKALLEEVKKDKTYDRIIINEDLDQFTNTNYEAIDRFLFSNIDNITDEIQDADIIFICSDRRSKSDKLMQRFFSIGIYNMLIGDDRSIEPLCEVIKKPRNKREAKMYLNINPAVAGIGVATGEDEVEEMQLLSIMKHYDKLGNDEAKYIESFDKIVEQYSRAQLKVIVVCLPPKVQQVLKNCERFNYLFDDMPQLRVEDKIRNEQVKASKFSLIDKIREKKEQHKKMQEIKIEEEKKIQEERLRLEREEQESKELEEKTARENAEKEEMERILKIEEEKRIRLEKEKRDMEINQTIETNIEKNEGPTSDTEFDIEKLNEKPVEVVNEDNNEFVIEDVITSKDDIRIREEEERKKREEENRKIREEEEREIKEERAKMQLAEENRKKEEQLAKEAKQNEELQKAQEEAKKVEQELKGKLEGEELKKEEELKKVEEEKKVAEVKAQENVVKNVQEEPKISEEALKAEIEKKVREELEQKMKAEAEKKRQEAIEKEKKSIPEEPKTYVAKPSYELPADYKKIVAFVGSSKSGTTFMVNAVSHRIADNGVKTAILDMTKDRGMYYIYNQNDTKLRRIATTCMENLSSGVDVAMPVERNLNVYTAVPSVTGDGRKGYKHKNILDTIRRNNNLTIVDCDFTTPFEYFEQSAEIYIVQDLDILRIQEVTLFLRELKSRGIDMNKIRVIINKYVKTIVTPKKIIEGLSLYNDPEMSFIDEILSSKVQYVVVPYDVNNYARYVEGLYKNEIGYKAYTVEFMKAIDDTCNLVYPVKASRTRRGIFG